MNGADTDGDGLSDGGEVKLLGTDPLSPDQDGDGLPDGWETAHFNSLARDGSADCDSDGLSDALELLLEVENLRDGGAWWAAIYGVAQSWTRLK